MKMQTLKALLVLLLLMGTSFNIFNIKPVFSQIETLNVTTEYSTIQAAINAANPGDIVNVSKGTYYEHLTINETKDGLKLIGESANVTIIDGNQTGTVVTVLANNVTITGFTVRGANSSYGEGIYIHRSSNNTIVNNICYNCSTGIKIHEDAEYNKIIGNIIVNNSDGVKLNIKSNNNLISNNRIMDNHFVGIHVLPYADNNTIEVNLIVNHNYSGIRLFGTSALGNKIMKNILIQNERGILVENSARNVISDNVIVKSKHGIEIPEYSSTRDNVIYHNDVIDNTYQLYPETQGNFSRWNNEANEGNYWSDYEGDDLDNDGVGETNTPHLGVDYYPLANPRSPIPIFQEGQIYEVILHSNDVTARFYFNQTSKEIVFRLVGPIGTAKYCNITIPKDLLDPAPSQSWIVTLDGTNLGATITDNATFTSLYFTYTHRARIHDVRISIGSSGIPISYIVGAIALILGIFLIVILVMRRRRNRRLSLSSMQTRP